MARSGKSAFFMLFEGVMIVQGVHVIEHIVQLIQVFVLGVPEDDALGLLGYLFQFQGTEEYLHLVFNVAYLLALLLLLRPLWQRVPQIVPFWAFVTFAVGAVGLESWHLVEHVVIISHVVQNHGCPCPGIVDAALGVHDTVLHFFYNALTYAAAIVPFWYVARQPGGDHGVAPRAHAPQAQSRY